MTQILKQAALQDASDVFVIAGRPIGFKINGCIQDLGNERLGANEVTDLVQEMYDKANRDNEQLVYSGDDDFSFSLDGIGRFRINAYRQRGSYAMVIRVVKFELPKAMDLGIPNEVMALADIGKGLIVVTGATGSGKSTTLACIIDRINQSQKGHIVTLEDPIEFIYRHGESIVSQREIGMDTDSYEKGLRAALREATDVIMVGEIRDLETVEMVLTAAETGPLVFSTLHTLGVANTIERMIDIFPTVQQEQARIQLSIVLQAIVSQQLVPTEEGLIPVFETLLINSDIRQLIRAGETEEIAEIIKRLEQQGLSTIDNRLVELYKQGKITKETAKIYSMDQEFVMRSLEG